VTILLASLVVLRLRVVSERSGPAVSTSFRAVTGMTDGLMTVVRDPDARLVVGLLSAGC
jgi:hypothetical protein